ncbi:hypothetical protein ACFSO7_00575 [Bacillus sp. CGMCC 1.16607]|uniref:hypothetical protein n=1 Tax=Bacillus sp. CGMCC 1.16607 TaxID=3351842 RepID=UPI00363D982A
MKRNIFIFTITIGMILLLSAFSFNDSFPRSYHHKFTKTTDLSKENIEGLFLNDKFNNEEILQKYGKRVEQSRNVTDYDYFDLKPGIEIAVNKTGEITRFIVSNGNVETAEGLKIGDEKKDVIRAYGNNQYVRAEQGAEIIGYVDKKREISIEFWLFNDKVNLYKLDNNKMK